MSEASGQDGQVDEAAAQEAERDAVLVERLKEGDAKALDQLYRRHRGAAYGIAFRLVGSREDALDVVQESFIHVMRGIQAFRGQSSFRTWLYRIVTHAGLDYRRWRSHRRAESLDAETALEPAADGPSHPTPPERRWRTTRSPPTWNSAGGAARSSTISSGCSTCLTPTRCRWSRRRTGAPSARS